MSVLSQWWWVVLPIVVNLIAFMAHGLDKRSAIQGRHRTPESRLHLWELLGGWPGALCAMLLFRHKIRKPSYLVVFVAIVLGWLAAFAWFVLAGDP